MADDGSLATKTEDWIVLQLQAIQFNAADLFHPEDVKPWEGSNAETVLEFSDNFFTSERDILARVAFVNEQVQDISSMQVKGRATYAIVVGIRNFREGAWRRGDGIKPGSNAIKNLIKYAFNQKVPSPSIGDGVFTVEMTHVQSFAVKLGTKNTCIMEATIAVNEVHAAT